MRSLYDGLWSMYSHAKDSMQADELEALANGLQETAVSLSRDTAAVLEGIACMVSSEELARAAGAPVSGSFRGGDRIFQLLCMAGRQFDLVAALVEVSSEAKFNADQAKEGEARTAEQSMSNMGVTP